MSHPSSFVSTPKSTLTSRSLLPTEEAAPVASSASVLLLPPRRRRRVMRTRKSKLIAASLAFCCIVCRLHYATMMHALTRCGPLPASLLSVPNTSVLPRYLREAHPYIWSKNRKRVCLRSSVVSCPEKYFHSQTSVLRTYPANDTQMRLASILRILRKQNSRSNGITSELSNNRYRYFSVSL